MSTDKQPGRPKEFVERVRVAVNLEAETLDRLKAEAVHRGHGVGHIIRVAADEWLLRNEGP